MGVNRYGPGHRHRAGVAENQRTVDGGAPGVSVSPGEDGNPGAGDRQNPGAAALTDPAGENNGRAREESGNGNAACIVGRGDERLVKLGIEENVAGEGERPAESERSIPASEVDVTCAIDGKGVGQGLGAVGGEIHIFASGRSCNRNRSGAEGGGIPEGDHGSRVKAIAERGATRVGIAGTGVVENESGRKRDRGLDESEGAGAGNLPGDENRAAPRIEGLGAAEIQVYVGTEPQKAAVIIDGSHTVCEREHLGSGGVDGEINSTLDLDPVQTVGAGNQEAIMEALLDFDICRPVVRRRELAPPIGRVSDVQSGALAGPHELRLHGQRPHQQYS